MNIYLRAMIAGFVATVVLSLLMLMKSMMGLMPELDVVRMLTGMAHGMMDLPANPAVGWMLHFLIGTVLWGPPRQTGFRLPKKGALCLPRLPSQGCQAAQAEVGRRLVAAAGRLPGAHWAVAVEHVPADWLQH